ncbi:MAG: hypothetical protein D5R98_00980 [Desulfonatronovibrio sp. MSAO_Bac4]|nr:MAG: hypothetical protein D5R98_00980 [Desulfonatronovibrio sp. MSAO_Bac4]
MLEIFKISFDINTLNTILNYFSVCTVRSWFAAVLLFVIFFTVLSAGTHAQTPPVRELSSGWYNRPPYQMLEGTGSSNIITGLEIKAAYELFESAGYQVSFEPMTWSEMLASLKAGSIDFVMGAYYDKSRTEYCYYSIPYRFERNSVYIHKKIPGTDKIESMDDLLVFLKENSLRMAAIGKVDEYIYGSDSFVEFLESSPESLTFVPSRGYNESMNLVSQGHADFFVANPVIADRIIARTGHTSQIKRLEPELWKLISRYFAEDEKNRAMPVSSAQSENLHNQFLYLGTKLRVPESGSG